jgi:LmbE family N-acetylglucosaminyl deacetylase
VKGFRKALLDHAVRSFRPRWVRSAWAEYERFAPVEVIDLPPGKKLCVVAPHPDDEAIGCGGLLALWTGAGREAEVVFLSNGELGSTEIRSATNEEDRARMKRSLAATRRSEAEASLKLLGAVGHWLDGPDGALFLQEARLAAELAAKWTQAPPDVIAAPFPADRHPDHAVAARIVGAASASALPAETVILGYEIWTPAPINAVLNISSVAEAKWRAIAAHSSQTATTDYVKAAQGLSSYRGVTSGHKLDCAEAFHLSTTEEYARKANSLKV